MFSSSSPIWCFLNALGATFKDPEQARLATKGLYLMEVFPALALPSLDSGFFGRLAGPKYNPDRRKTFRKDDWARVAEAAAQGFHALGCEEMAGWCRDAGRIDQSQKADQDKIDSVLCVLIALRWRLSPRNESLLIGDPDTGYMVTPASPAVRDCLVTAGLQDELARDDQAPSFYVLRNERGVAGTVALEVVGDDAILRSLAVDPDFRGAGYGWMLADMAVSQARWRGVRRIYLVTAAASDFFAAKFGFRVVDRSTIAKQVATHETFMRPGSGQLVAMRLDL